MSSNRFAAEAILRDAASGAIPEPGDVLLRIENGWIFSKVTFAEFEGEIDPDQISSLPFTKITGIATKGQLPASIAYEDEANFFLLINTFQNQVRRGIRTITSGPYIWQSDDWHLNVNTDGGGVQVYVPDAAVHFNAGFTDQLHIKHAGSTKNPVYLVPVISGQEIDGYSSAIIREPNKCFTLVSDGSNWWIQ